MSTLTELQTRFAAALSEFTSESAKYAAMVRPTQDAKHGDYQANFAMPLAKELGRKPTEVAAEVVARLDAGDLIEPPQIAGPGFVNLTLRADWIAGQIRRRAGDDRLGAAAASPAKTFVIDYSSPNVAKPLHVGHLRSTIIGDALARLLRFLGHRVVSDNHLGDWGTQFGILLYGYKNHLDAAAYAADPITELARLYVHVRGLMKGDEDEATGEIAEACRAETAKLHAGDAENLRLWQQFMPACTAEIDRMYRRLGVTFDHTHGESHYQPMLADVVADLVAKGIAVESAGALGIFRPDKPDAPPALVRKRDGAFTYTTTDLATIRARVDLYHPDAMLYVVDARQSFHFDNLFAAAKRWGYDGVEMIHVSFGSVLGADRKPIKTREGGAVTLESLLDEGVEQAKRAYEQNLAERRERGEDVPELSPSEMDQLAEVIGLGAIKYADLSQHRTTDYVFSWPKMLAMNGNTATYMQYAYARCRSIFRKGGVDVLTLRNSAPVPSLGQPAERALAVKLLQFDEALAATAAEYLPHYLTAYLWDLAKAYSKFFDECPVLKAETESLRAERLLLCDLTARTIQRALEILGIHTVERM